MPVEDKIQDCKDCFDELNKSGVNNYQNFKYVETKDLFPVVRAVCKKFKLRTNFEWDNINNLMWLIVTDQEDKSEYRANIPVAPVTASDAGKYMQDIGRVQTYSMRYLYIQVFEIAVPDEIDNKDQKKFKKGTINQANRASAKQTKKTQYSPVKPVIEHKEQEITEDDVKNMLDLVNETLVSNEYDVNMENMTKVLHQKCFENKQLEKACLTALKFNKEQKVNEKEKV